MKKPGFQLARRMSPTKTPTWFAPRLDTLLSINFTQSFRYPRCIKPPPERTKRHPTAEKGRSKGTPAGCRYVIFEGASCGFFLSGSQAR